MSKKLLILFCCTLLTLAMVVGCSDDDEDCPTCPEAAVTPLGYVYGTLVLDPEAYMDNMRIHGYGAIPPNIDSVMIGDSLVNPNDFDYDYEWEYEDNFWEIYFSEDGDASTYMYDVGDIATITVWGSGRSSTCQLKLLDDDSCEVDIESPIYGDTIDVDESVTAHWTPSEATDYYSVWLEYDVEIEGSSYYLYFYDYTMDTSYTVSADMRPDSLTGFYINVTPFNGPDPRTGESNWVGNFLAGKLYSYGEEDYVWLNIEEAGASAGQPKAAATEEHIRLTPAEAINNLYKQYE